MPCNGPRTQYRTSQTSLGCNGQETPDHRNKPRSLTCEWGGWASPTVGHSIVRHDDHEEENSMQSLGIHPVTDAF